MTNYDFSSFEAQPNVLRRSGHLFIPSVWPAIIVYRNQRVSVMLMVFKQSGRSVFFSHKNGAGTGDFPHVPYPGDRIIISPPPLNPATDWPRAATHCHETGEWTYTMMQCHNSSMFDYNFLFAFEMTSRGLGRNKNTEEEDEEEEKKIIGCVFGV